ncbi:hypothetical protein T01_7796 [Trichinella spiralis]|uniref:Uncharacterized protein n=1 Tax=Trichinella spiralis TaxID=6334 RepID=A0A0V1BP99_TRISP|nr:hypothetical protein T01_7796 [Trichinella spiralis]
MESSSVQGTSRLTNRWLFHLKLNVFFRLLSDTSIGVSSSELKFSSSPSASNSTDSSESISSSESSASGKTISSGSKRPWQFLLTCISTFMFTRKQTIKTGNDLVSNPSSLFIGQNGENNFDPATND